MGCTSCKTGTNGMPSGCGDKGHCATGGCNKLNTYDWLTALNLEDPTSSDFAEISFKNGSRKSFYKISDPFRYNTGDMVVVDTGSGGYDVGRISLMGDLVRLQMKKKNFKEDRIAFDVIRKANQRDLERMIEARQMEKPGLVKARVISRTLKLDMKIGDVEYQADLKKATFYYTADGWIDFRELVRQYAKEFRIKIEMRQIGSRQESARIGGIGSCGRELCCSTWLTDFKSVNTTAARYQNIAINQSKLSGQCGRLKCCLNYELDMYVDELEKYPSNVERLRAKQGTASLIKVDIFKGMLYYLYEPVKGRSVVMPLSPEEVRRIKAMNDRNEMPEEIIAAELAQVVINPDEEFVDVTGEIELPSEKRKKKKKKKPNRDQNSGQGNQNQNQARPPQTDKPNVNPNHPNQTNRPNSGNPNQRPPNPNQQNRNNPNTNNPNQNKNPNSDQRNPNHRKPNQEPNRNQGQRPPNPNQQNRDKDSNKPNIDSSNSTDKAIE